MTEFDPELRTAARLLPRRAVNRRTLPIVRAITGLVGRLAPPHNVEVVRLSQSCSVRLHRPQQEDAATGALLWIHGGGFVFGVAAQDDIFCRRMANKLNVVVAAVDYRVAPEHPYPAALDDCYEAVQWLAARDATDPRRIVIAGASAGGGLAAALTNRCVDDGSVRPRAQVLSYPMLDDRTVLRTDLAGPFRLWNPPANAFGWTAYLGSSPGAQSVDEYAAPARRTNMAGLPPTWLGVGTRDLFHDEGVAYARRLTEAGVPVELHIAVGAFHAFDSVVPGAAVSRKFSNSQLHALRTAFSRA